jgi:hypothetical protein
MGLFDSVYANCPHCGKPVEFQTKADEMPYMNVYTLEDAPDHLLRDVLNSPHHCQSCYGWLVLLDPRYPITPPRPNPIAAKVKTPDHPDMHFQGMKWWPRDKDFTVDDLED